MNYTILTGDNRQTLKTIPDNSIDAIVTDPPYLIDFLGKEWDANDYDMTDTFKECLRVLKPGGHILAFSAARTYHKMAVMIENAGFEIRDQIMWIYSSGFPKSQDIGKQIDKAAGKKDPNYTGPTKTTKQTANEGDIAGFGAGVRCNKCDRTLNAERVSTCAEVECAQKYKAQTDAGKTWSGWGTALKPAHEPIALARKPIKTSIRENCLKYGTGALNIDATRIPTDDVIITSVGNGDTFNKFNAENNTDGPGTGTKINSDVPKWTQAEGGRFPSNVVGDIPLYQKYFYCPKVSRKERHVGCVDPGVMFSRPRNKDGKPVGEGESMWMDPKVSGPKKIAEQPAGTNNHPTVKPIELMKYLIKLVTPPGGTVLDPFNGSGSTGCAAVELGYTYIGCELDPAYVAIASKRIEAWYAATRDPARDIFD